MKLITTFNGSLEVLVKISSEMSSVQAEGLWVGLEMYMVVTSPGTTYLKKQ